LRFFNKKVAGVLISIFFIVLICCQVNIKESLKYLNHINLNYIWLILPVYYFSFIIRAVRWRMILSRDYSLKINSLISSLFIGFMSNCLLPARMGEIYRAHLFGKKENINRVEVFASVVVERIFDGFILFFILLFSIVRFYSKPWVIKLAFAAGSIFIGGFIFLLLFAKSTKTEVLNQFFSIINNKLPAPAAKILQYGFNKINSVIEPFASGLTIFNSNSLLLKSLFLTFIIWLLEGSFIFLVIKSFGISIHLFAAIFILCVVAFSTMIPAGPASIGPYQWGYILALGVFGVVQEKALAVSIINQLVMILSVSVAGLFYMWKDHINIKDIENEIKINESYNV